MLRLQNWLLILSLLTGVDYCSSVAPGSDEERCSGYRFDLSRLRTITNAVSEDFGGSKDYQVRHASATESGSSCRLRLIELSNGIPIYGADTVATLADCSSTESSAVTEQITLASEGLSLLSFQDVTGKTFEAVDVQQGYQPTFSVEAVADFLSTKYNISAKEDNMEVPQLFIFPTPEEDFLAYFAKLLVKDNNGSFSKILRVIVDAHTLKILSTCTLYSSSNTTTTNGRRLRPTEQRKLSLCTTCANKQGISSFATTTTTQQINSLYLSNSGKQAIVTPATLTAGGGTINTPYKVDEYFWEGTYHCFLGTEVCHMVELPTTCADALSDVHFVAIETLKYMKANLNILGGLSASAFNPQSVTAFVHYDNNLCK